MFHTETRIGSQASGRRLRLQEQRVPERDRFILGRGASRSSTCAIDSGFWEGYRALAASRGNGGNVSAAI